MSNLGVFQRCIRSCLHVMLSALVELMTSHLLLFLYLFSYIYCFLEGVLLLPSVAILSILDQLVQYLVHFRELQWVFSGDFIGLRISFLAHFWPSYRSFICLSECIDCPHMIVPYSNFDWIKDLYICTARSKRMSGKRVNWLHACLLFLLCFLHEEWKKVLHLWWFSVLAVKRIF